MSSSRKVSLLAPVAGVIVAAGLLFASSGFAGDKNRSLPSGANRCVERCTEKINSCMTGCMGSPDGGAAEKGVSPADTKCMRQCQETLSTCVSRCMQ